MPFTAHSRRSDDLEPRAIARQLTLRVAREETPLELRQLCKVFALAIAFGISARCLHFERSQVGAKRWKVPKQEVWGSAERLLFIRGLGTLASVGNKLEAKPSSLPGKASKSRRKFTFQEGSATLPNPIITSHEEGQPKKLRNRDSLMVMRKRVAVCIVGHARSFYRPSVHNSIARNLLQPIAGNSTTLEVFFHIGLRDIAKVSNATALTSRSETREAAEAMKPVVLSLYDDPILQLNMTQHNSCSGGMEHARRVYPPALLRASQCMALVRDFETKNNFRYDWIVKTRPDIAIGDPVTPLSKLRPDRIYINEHIPGTSTPAFQTIRELYPRNAAKLLGKPFADHIAMVPREYADVFFSSHLAAGECLTQIQKSRLVNAETIMGMWLIQNGVRYETMPWFWILVRDKQGPECSRVQWIGRSTNETAEFSERCLVYNETGIIPSKAEK